MALHFDPAHLDSWRVPSAWVIAAAVVALLGSELGAGRDPTPVSSTTTSPVTTVAARPDGGAQVRRLVDAPVVAHHAR